jgi:hypothetical protein
MCYAKVEIKRNERLSEFYDRKWNSVSHTGGDRQGREGHRIIANRWADEFLTSLVYVGKLPLNRKRLIDAVNFFVI